MDGENKTKNLNGFEKLRRFLLLGLLTGIALVICSCGGGTVGTGDMAETRFAGTLRAVSGTPISGALISVAETGDSSQTDQNGAFSIQTNRPGPKATLLVESGTLSQQVSVNEIPNKDSTVTLALEVDTDNGLVQVVSVSIEVDDGAPANDDNSDLDEDGASAPENISPDVEDDSEQDIVDAVTVFQGSLVYLDGSPVQGARINLAKLGASAQTNAKGTFSLRAPAKGGTVVLEIRFRGAATRVSIRGVPKNKNATVKFSLLLNLMPPDDKNVDVQLLTLPISLSSLQVVQ